MFGPDIFRSILLMPLNIVVIEDDTPIANMYKMKLELAGYTAYVAENGKIGLELVKDIKPDLILLDIRMPVMSGDIMLEKLRQTDWGSSIRVVILTNISRDEAPRNLSLLGVDRYIVKAHHTPVQILDVVNEILN